MFDLEMQVTAWRSQLLQNEAVAMTEVDELESHLRDTLDAIRGGSVSEQEAFWLAVRRVGSPEALSLEFSKINGARTWTRRLQWMLAGYLLLSVFLSVIGTLGQALTMSAVFFHLPLWAAVIVSGFGATLCIVSLLLLTWNVTNGHSLGMQKIATRFASLVRSGYQGWLVLAVLLIVLLKNGVDVVTSVVASRLMPMQEFGIAAIVSSSSNWMGNILLFGTIIALLCWLVSRDGQPISRRWTSSRVLIAMLLLAVVMLGGFGIMSLGFEHVYGEQFAAY